MHVRAQEYQALERVVAEAEGILVPPFNRFGCIVLCPRQEGSLRGVSQATDSNTVPRAAVPGPADVTVIDDFEMA